MCFAEICRGFRRVRLRPRAAPGTALHRVLMSLEKGAAVIARRPDGVSDATVEAVGKTSEASEYLIRVAARSMSSTS